VILALHGRPVRSEADFMRFIVMHPGQRVPVVVLRDGRRHTIYVVYPQAVVQTQAGGAYLGVLFDAQVPDAAIVIRVNPGSPAQAAGLQPRDVILALDGQEIRSYQDAISLIRSMRPGQELEILVQRGQSEGQMVAVLDVQPSVRTATRGVDVRVERETMPTDQKANVQVDVNTRDSDGRLLDRDRSYDGNRDRPLLPRLRN
jgi:S1-C subfamily serine protease